ncbi:hypothetical protein L1987_64149 [Smallanthus sonchifolius]|uniref:Uncharacterized protein n=1 Tax=Smallanthus sonchifolius TaxID=185202 RepID=A0ACB9CF93_9ASTR|nr:hypothetical protein L1987_64149 [Smallanthus sonchifolius]
MHTMMNPKDYTVFEGLADILPDLPNFSPELIAPPPLMENPCKPELPTVAISEEVESALRPEPTTMESMFTKKATLLAAHLVGTASGNYGRKQDPPVYLSLPLDYRTFIKSCNPPTFYVAIEAGYSMTTELEQEQKKHEKRKREKEGSGTGSSKHKRFNTGNKGKGAFQQDVPTFVTTGKSTLVPANHR